MSTKWSEKCDPELPVREFARTVLAERMEVVESLLPLAAYHHEDDIEHVHQLRVGSRRAAAALSAFTPLVSKRPRKLKMWLKRIRSAAGPARDCDVLLKRFAQESPPDPVTEYATARLTEERQEAQKDLVKVSKKAIKGKLDLVIERTLLSLDEKKKNKAVTLAEFGHTAVRLAFAPFARLMHLKSPTPDELHQLRIAGKRLRYSLEIFHGLFPEVLREEIYPIVEELQSRLGKINDHVTAQALFQSWLAEMPAEELAAQVGRRVEREHKAAVKQSRAFLQWWNAQRIAKIEGFFSEHTPPVE